MSVSLCRHHKIPMKNQCNDCLNVKNTHIYNVLLLFVDIDQAVCDPAALLLGNICHVQHVFEFGSRSERGSMV